MFNRAQDESNLQKEIDRVLTEMTTLTPETDEYANLLAKLERLTALIDDNHVRKPVSLDTLVMSGANILGILVIVIYEQKHVMVSKALGYVRPTK